MAPSAPKTDPTDDIEYLIGVIMNAEDFKPKFAPVAADFGISSANIAQKKFKSIVERSGKFLCKSNVITKKDDASSTPDDDPPATPSAAMKPPAPKAKASKKRAAPAAETDKPSKKVKDDEA